MDYSSGGMDRQHVEVLGVNKMGKNIKKSPIIHQPNFGNSDFGPRPQPQSQVYNINKSDFRNIVQQLTGSPSRNTLLSSRPHQNPSKNNLGGGGTRLQRIRPSPLMPMNQQPEIPCNNNFVLNPFSPGNTAKSPISPGFLTNPPLPSPWMNNDAPILSPLLPSQTSQFLLPSSPTGFVNLFSPCTPYPLFSPGVQYPSPPSPNFSFSPMGQPGFFTISSPRWRDQ